VTEKARQGTAEELLTMMAHDLHNYLTPLKGRIDMLERRARRENQVSYVQELETAKQTLERLNRLVSSLLDVARLNKGIFALDPQSVDLVDLLEELVSIWRTSEHPIQVQAPDKLVLTADRDRIQQVLENLLSNATTYADPNTPIQVVIAQEQRGDTSWATVTISNQGPDIPSDFFTSLFHPFVKGVHSKGLGLGLSLAERIARAHQGTLTAYTGSERTTNFTLSLPLALA
jgi:signal transduction histidine kinase